MEKYTDSGCRYSAKFVYKPKVTVPFKSDPNLSYDCWDIDMYVGGPGPLAKTDCQCDLCKQADICRDYLTNCQYCMCCHLRDYAANMHFDTTVNDYEYHEHWYYCNACKAEKDAYDKGEMVDQ